MKFRTVRSVVAGRLCLGCGACAYICPERKVSLVNDYAQGIRAVVSDEACGSCWDCLEVCPAYLNDHRPLLQWAGLMSEVAAVYGPVREIWEGHAADPEVRFRGSSGGVLTALALYALEQEGMHGVLHIGADSGAPLENRTALSRSREGLLARTGSRYAPASVCDGLGLIEQASGLCVFIGQPSEVTALRKAQALRPALARNVGLALSFFCAGSPSTRGTVEYVRALGVNPEQVSDLRYRGNGWPGMFAVGVHGQEGIVAQRTYRESWGFLQAYRPFAVYLNPDCSGEDADIACGDPWYREPRPGEAGVSIVVVRTERGQRLLQAAIKAGYLVLERVSGDHLMRSQKGFAEKRGAIWGRRLALRLFGLPAPRLAGFALFRNWWRLPFLDKLRSVVGTARRILSRGYLKPYAASVTAAAPAAANRVSQT